MNLHEECLLKYLLNPLGLSISTELLKKNNESLIKAINNSNVLANARKVIYSTNRY